MRTRSTFRRGLALTTATALLTGGLAGLVTTPAWAAGAVTSFSPTSWDNRSSVTFTVTGSGFAVDPTGLTNDTIVFTPLAPDTANEVAQFTVQADPGNSATSVTAKINLATAPAGDYLVQVGDSNGSNLSSPAVSHFTIYGYGGANATGVAFGPNPTGTVVACNTTVNCLARTNIAGRPLDITGSNIAIGATVRFLKNGTSVPDDGLTFVQNNPNNDTNAMNTQAADGRTGTGYASSTLLQGNYTSHGDTTEGVTPGFTPGLHQLQIVNHDGKTTGTTVDFAQPWFAGSSAMSPGSIGVGAKNVTVTLTGQGIRAGSSLAIASNATTSCAGVTVGSSTVSGPDGHGTYTTISAPVSMADCSTDDLSARDVSVVGPDGGIFTRNGYFSIVTNPSFASAQPITSGYESLGQGAHVGYGGEVVQIDGTGFVGDPDFDHVPGGLPDKMTKFFACSGSGPCSSSDGITIKTVFVGIGFAQVEIDVASDAPLGDRALTAVNPDGGSVTAAGDGLPAPIGTPAPLTITAGPQVTKVDPAGLPPTTSQGAKTVVVTGTFTTADSFTARMCEPQVPATLDCHDVVNASVGGVTDTATSLTFPVSTNGAPPGTKDLLITESNKGRFYCKGCIGIDSLTLNAPTSVPNTGDAALFFSLDPSVGSGTALTTSTATLTRLVTLAGQPAISLKAPLTPGAAGSNAATGTFDVTRAAPGQYSVTIVKDPTLGASSPTWTCTGCLTITGAAITTTSIDRVPSDGTVDTSTSVGQGATGVPLTIVGTNFDKGVQVQIPDATYDITGVTPTTISVTVDVADDVPSGAKTVTVTSGDGVGPNTGSKTTNLTLNVTAKPANLSAPSPASYGQGAGSAGYTAVHSADSDRPSITITGDNFADDATLDLGPGITVTSHAVTQGSAAVGVCPACIPATPDSLTATVAIAENAAPGKRALAVVNGDGGRTTVADAFTVNEGPAVLSVANVNSAPLLVPDGVAHSITVLGSNFSTSPAATLAVVPSTGVTIANVVVSSAGKITADVTVATDAALGARAVGVTNSSDKGYGSLTPVYVAKAPNAPASLTITPLGGALKATWTAPAGTVNGISNGAPITGYHLTLQKVGSATKVLADVSGSTLTHTFTGLTNGSTYSIAVNAVNVAGAGPAIARTGIAGVVTTLSSAVSSTLTTAGSAVRFSGKLVAGTAPVSGRTVVLHFTPQVGAPFTVNVRTDTAGGWAYVKSMVYTLSMRPTFAGDSTYRPSTGTTRSVSVRAKVVITSPASTSSSSHLTTLKVTGYVYPNHHGSYVYLYRYSGSTKTLVQKVLLSSTSTYSFSTTLAKGTYTLRVYIANTTGNLANYSPAITVHRT